MSIEMTEISEALEIATDLGDDGDLEIYAYVEPVYISREEAIKLIAELTKVFDLDSAGETDS